MRQKPTMQMLTFYKQRLPTIPVVAKQPRAKRYSLLHDIIASAPKSCGCGGK